MPLRKAPVGATTRYVVVDARNARMGGALTFLAELVPLLEAQMPPATVVEVLAGPAPSVRTRFRRAVLLMRADAVLHTGNRGAVCRAPTRVLCIADRLLLPSAERSGLATFRLVLRRLALVAALIRATDVVVPSKSMVEPLQPMLRLLRPRRPPPVHVVHHGGPSWMPGKSPPRSGPLRLLFPSHVGPHKNFPLLARLMEEVSAEQVKSLTLTARPGDMVGGSPLSEWFSASRAPVKFQGPLCRERLPALYESHDAVVFPSLAESFGLPLVEAMAMGLPVLVSDRPWAHELCGEAALYADPYGPSTWTAKLTDLQVRFSELREQGFRRAEAFSWGSAAKAYASLLSGTS